MAKRKVEHWSKKKDVLDSFSSQTFGEVTFTQQQKPIQAPLCFLTTFLKQI